MLSLICEHCGEPFQAKARRQRFCSTRCASRARYVIERVRECRHCGNEFPVSSRADANRQHCSRACAKAHGAKRTKAWVEAHPEARSLYEHHRKEKSPKADLYRSRRRRADILELLGGACVVCGVTNPYWLHVDYVPTQRDIPHRHPRHFSYISQHVDEFRILCANHHYELTLTGRIEGTDITQ